nr:histidine kinase [Burkholderia sola]
MSWLTAIALTGAAAIAVCALVLNVSESRSADAKLKLLAQRVVESQEQERARLSRELHDGISQMMVSAKLMLAIFEVRWRTRAMCGGVLSALERAARPASANGRRAARQP